MKGKLYRLLFEMNRNVRIRVQTAVGLTDSEDTGESIGQGTVEGALISAVNLDNGVKDFFAESDEEVTYGEVILRPIIFQDDVAKLSVDRQAAQAANDKMETMIETKLLDFNLDKSCFIVCGNKKARARLQSELDNNPLTLCGRRMKQVFVDKYLGDQLSVSLSESVKATVNKRTGVATHSIYEIRSVIDDCRAKVVGGMTAAFDMWEMSVLPMLLYNCETWVNIPESTMNQLIKTQNQFYRVALGVGIGCPIPCLYWQTGGMMMPNRILQKKLLFLHHVATLPTEGLAREIFEVQSSSALPGLTAECLPYLVEFGIIDIKAYKVPMEEDDQIENKGEESK